MAIIAFLSRSPGLLNRGPGGPASLGHVPHSSVFSPTDLNFNCSIRGLRAPSVGCWLSLPHLLQLVWSPTAQSGVLGAPSAGCWFSLPHLIFNWLNFLCTELYNSSTSTIILWASQIALNQPIHCQGYILIFLDRMHLLFTPVHFLFWQLGRGQYVTQGWSCGRLHCPGGNATDPIWRVLASSDWISSWTPLKPQHSKLNPNPLANQLWCIDFLTPASPLIIPHRLPAFLESLMPLKNWCSIRDICSKSSLKHSIRFCGIIFSKFKTEFYCISFF